MLKPLFGADDKEWVIAVGRFMLNMGGIEAATALLAAQIEGKAQGQAVHQELTSRIGFIRQRFPRDDKVRHTWGMNVLSVALKITTFRDIIAHSPVVCTVSPDGSTKVQGILDVRRSAMVSLVELKGRIDESAIVARGLLEMQTDFPQQ